MGASGADARIIETLRRERDEALAREAATAEVLGVINASSGDLAPVFEAILDKAHRLCGATQGTLQLYDGAHFRAVATHGLRPDWAQAQFRPRPPTNEADHELLRGARLVHYPDLSGVAARYPDDARMRNAVASGVRTILRVPFRREGTLLGYISAYREEVKPFSEQEIALLESFAQQAVIAMENARLLDETRQRTADLQQSLEYQTATSDVLKIISRSTFDLQPVLDTVVQTAARLFNASFSFIANKEGELCRPVALYSVSPAWEGRLRSQTFPTDRGTVLGRTALEGRVVQVPDITIDAEHANPEATTLGLSRTVLGAPLIREGETIGVLILARQRVEPFTERQIELIRTFADQSVIAIENTRLINETREALEQQTATAEVLGVINSSRSDLTPVFDAILERAMRLCDAELSHFMQYDGRHFDTLAMRGASQDYAEFMRRSLAPGETGGSLAALVRGEAVVHVPDLRDSEAYRSGNPARRALVDLGRARTGIWVALRNRAGLRGALVLYRSEGRPFSDKQIALLQNFAAQAVIAMDNARLLTETREALEQQTATAEVLGVINASPGDLQPVFESILDKAHTLCGANIGWLLTFDGEFVHTQAMRGMPDLDPAVASKPFLPGPAMQKLIEGESFFQIPDIRELKDAPGTPPVWRAACELLGAGSYLIVPLRKDGAVRGFINAFRTPVRLFSDKEIALLENFAQQAVIAIENARLITETREALAQQTATAEVLGVINSSPGDLAPVFDAMLEKGMALCEADCGGLGTWQGNRFEILALKGVSPDYAAQIQKTGDAPGPREGFARVAQGAGYVQLLDASVSEFYEAGDPFTRGAVDLGGARTTLTVPLAKEGEVLGVFCLYRREVRAFSERQIALIKNFTQQAVIAMENARLLEETRQRTHDLQEALAYQTATGEVLRIVASSPDRLAPVFDAILDRAMALCDVKASNLYLHEDGVFTAVAAHHPDPHYAAEMISNPVRPGPGTAIHRAFTSRMPVHIRDIADDNAYGAGNPFRVRMVERGVRAVLIVPLVRGNEAIGAITIYRPVPEPYTDAQIELVRTFADQAVIAIENARLFGELRAARDAAEAAYRDLQTAQSSLVQAQKMAALGQLTAGIAHEIKNPLNFVNNFAGLSTELLAELKEEMAPALTGLDGDTREAVDETIAMLTGNLDKIAEHGRRADNIVKSMLEHSRGVSGERRFVDLNALIEEALNLAFHGARAQDQSFNITMERDFAEPLAPVEVAPQEMTRVFLNLFGNGFYAAHKRAQANHDAGYRPTLRIATHDTGDAVEITIRDNGTGIPADVRDKLFQPFFTTKPTGEGTGLGLSISYDIVTQQHGGTIAVASEEGAYTEFTIRLPRG